MNRTLIWQLALRYLRGKRAGNAVPILSRISMTAIAVGSGALIILFSVFNGFESLVKDLYKAFYPDIKITAARGKFFSITSQQRSSITHIAGITAVASVIEDNVLANNGDDQFVATIKGVDTAYFSVNDIKPYITEGDDSLSDAYPGAIMGEHIANLMGADVHNVFSSVMFYYPNTKLVDPSLDPADAFQSLKLKPEGIFKVQDEFDSKYVLASLPLVQQLFGEPGRVSSIEIAIGKNSAPDAIKLQLQQMLGSSYKVETRFEQNKTLYLVMRTEKWAVYAILLLVLLIASFNTIGALSLLILEKQKDMAILRAMGAPTTTIRQIFLAEGVLWSLTGGLIGMLLGGLLCLGQQYFGWIKIGGSFIIDAYPVQLQAMDFLLVIATILLVGLLAAWFPSRRATRTEIPSLKTT